MATTRAALTAWLVVVVGLALLAATLVRDESGAHLELVPVFFGGALVVVCLRISRTGRPRD